MTPRLVVGLALLLSGLAAVGEPTASSEAAGQRPRLVIESTDGRDLYAFYCASCHGRTGHGDGPVAAALRGTPADLTTLARRHGGTFPEADVRAALTATGDRPAAPHGPAEMPVWGRIFRALDPDDHRLEVRIVSLVAYVASLQGT